jgi:peptide/nickel transport system permease protein
MRRDPRALLGLGLVALVLAAAGLGPLLWRVGPEVADFMAPLAAPSAKHPLGTDDLGRDTLARMLAGARVSLLVGMGSVAGACLLGGAIGLVCGFLRGWTDRVLMAFNDALLAFPGILLALALMVIVGANRWGIVLALGLAYAPTMARVVRGVVLSLRETEYVEASRMIGNSDVVTMLRHVLPNCVAPVAVLATSMFLHPHPPGATCSPAAGRTCRRRYGWAWRRACASR